MSSLIFNKTAANFYRKVKILFCVFLKASVTFDHGVCWGRLSWQPLGTMVNTGEKEEPKLKQFSFFIHNFLIIIILHLHSNSDTTTELKYWQTHRHTHTHATHSFRWKTTFRYEEQTHQKQQQHKPRRGNPSHEWRIPFVRVSGGRGKVQVRAADWLSRGRRGGALWQKERRRGVREANRGGGNIGQVKTPVCTWSNSYRKM